MKPSRSKRKEEGKKEENPYRGNEVNANLIVLEGHILPDNPLLFVLLLLLLENKLVEVKLEGLVGVVDAKLLEAEHD